MNKSLHSLSKWILYAFSVSTWAWGCVVIIFLLEKAHIYYSLGLVGIVFMLVLPYWLCSIAIAYSQRSLLTEDDEHKTNGRICLSIWISIALLFQALIDIFIYPSQELPSSFYYGSLASKMAVLIACFYLAKMVARKLLTMSNIESIIRKACVTSLSFMACFSIGATIVLCLLDVQ